MKPIGRHDTIPKHPRYLAHPSPWSLSHKGRGDDGSCRPIVRDSRAFQ
ncbi:hypothetical protein KL86PLE_100056 [uncultured Pleomorphomonas sp.]|uniref:Uncharacterized protein n=1 Tax=uncultured Pleomorphomonas sp. TaxID=442121 RepID=A0A212L0W7_9HYPH|nr:hypothetical protein KL86PLE_100056 [uncultured Pleomorphomonas sp.]